MFVDILYNMAKTIGRRFDEIVKVNKKEKRYRLFNGSVIEFKTADDPDRLIARGLDFWHLDEGWKVPFRVFENLVLRVRAGSSMRGWITTTPYTDDPTGWWLEKVFFAPATRWKETQVIIASSYENPGMSKEYFDDLSKMMDEKFVRSRLFASLERFEGLVYNFKPDEHLVEPFEIPKHWKRIIGIDFGFYDPFAALWLAQDPKTGIWYAYREYLQAKKDNIYHAKQIKDMSEGEKIDRIYTDPTGGHRKLDSKQNLVDLQVALRGYGMETYFTSAISNVQAGISAVNKLFEEGRLKIFRTLQNLYDELTSYTWGIVGKHGANDHLLDALRYALATEERLYPFDRIKEVPIELRRDIEPVKDDYITWLEKYFNSLTASSQTVSSRGSEAIHI